MLSTHPLILASKSPRRQELLKRITQNFLVFDSEVDETVIIEGDPVNFAISAALMKARKVGEVYPASLVLGADTLVALEGKIFGKPKDRLEAESMLTTLSGRQHQVITGIALYVKADERLVTDHVQTDVRFRDLPSEVVATYLDQNNYRDKAGSYAIQDIGDSFIQEISGDYDNVVGLPVDRVRELLDRF